MSFGALWQRLVAVKAEGFERDVVGPGGVAAGGTVGMGGARHEGASFHGMVGDRALWHEERMCARAECVGGCDINSTHMRKYHVFAVCQAKRFCSLAHFIPCNPIGPVA